MNAHDHTAAGQTLGDRDHVRFNAAIEAAIANREWDQVASLIETHWQDFVVSDPQLLLDAILALPTEAYRERPRLESGANYLEHLVAGRDPHRYHDHTRTRDNPTLFDQLVELTSRTAGHRTAGNLPGARRYAREAKRLLEEAPDHERAEARNSLPDLLLQWARSLELADSGEEIQLYEEAYELAQLLGNQVVQRRAAASLAWMTAWQGRLRQAEGWVVRAHRSGPPNPRYDAPLFLATALIHADRFEHDDAQQAVDRISRLPVGEYWAAALFVRSRLAETPADAMVIEDDLDLEEGRQPRGLVTGGANGSYLALTMLRLEKISGASHTETAGSASVRHLQRALRAIAGGDFHTALAEATNLTRTKGPPRARATGLLLVAASRARLGRRTGSLTALSQAQAIIDHDKLYSSYLVLPAEEVFQLIHAAAVPLDPWVATVLRDSRSDAAVAASALSRREREVLQLLTTDLTMNEIAHALFISPNTVKSTTRRLYRKLGVTSRAEAADHAAPTEPDAPTA